MEMDAAAAYEVIQGVMQILEEESHEAGRERIFVCLTALDSVAKWLDVVAEVDQAIEP